MKNTRVHIIVGYDDRNEDDLLCCVVHNGLASSVHRLEGQAVRLGSNPYTLYGDLIERVTGLNWRQTSITVSKISSGNMTDWLTD